MRYLLAFALLIFATSADARNTITITYSYHPPKPREFPRPPDTGKPTAPSGVHHPVQK